MTDTIAIHGHDIIDLVATYPEGIRLSQLMEVAAERYGRMATFRLFSRNGHREQRWDQNMTQKYSLACDMGHSQNQDCQSIVLS